MATFNWLGRTAAVRQFVAAVQASATAAVDSSDGSITLALGQAVTGIYLWLQALIVNVLMLTRASTSSGADLDSFYADFSFPRLPAVQATSTETFSRYTPTLQAIVPVGQIITTGPGGLQYAVTLDSTNGAYNAAVNGYVLPPNTSSVTVPIQAILSGAANGNVLANTVTSFGTPIPGIDTCTNGADITNGLDAESDEEYRARFPLYLASLATSDEAAIEYAISNVQRGILYFLVENYDYPGTTVDNGNFFVIVDDGTGAPPDSLVSSVQNAIEAIRGFTIRYSVNKPTVIVPTIALSIRVASGYSSGAVAANVQSAVVNAVNGIPLNAMTLYISEIEAAALSVPGVVSVQPGGATKINASNADLALTLVQAPRITTANVTVGTY